MKVDVQFQHTYPRNLTNRFRKYGSLATGTGLHDRRDFVVIANSLLPPFLGLMCMVVLGGMSIKSNYVFFKALPFISICFVRLRSSSLSLVFFTAKPTCCCITILKLQRMPSLQQPVNIKPNIHLLSYVAFTCGSFQTPLNWY